jgi:hypothetical protein
MRLKIKNHLLAIVTCAFLSLVCTACCCRDNGSALHPDPDGMSWGPPSGGLSCRLILRQPMINGTAPFDGEIQLKNISRQVIFIETPRLREEDASPVSLILDGRALACAAVRDGLKAFPDEIIQIEPGDIMVLYFSWRRDRALEDGVAPPWPGPGRYGMKARLTCPAPRGGILENQTDSEGYVFFQGILESNEWLVDVY